MKKICKKHGLQAPHVCGETDWYTNPNDEYGRVSFSNLRARPGQANVFVVTHRWNYSKAPYHKDIEANSQ